MTTDNDSPHNSNKSKYTWTHFSGHTYKNNKFQEEIIHLQNNKLTKHTFKTPYLHNQHEPTINTATANSSELLNIEEDIKYVSRSPHFIDMFSIATCSNFYLYDSIGSSLYKIKNQLEHIHSICWDKEALNKLYIVNTTSKSSVYSYDCEIETFEKLNENYEILKLNENKYTNNLIDFITPFNELSKELVSVDKRTGKEAYKLEKFKFVVSNENTYVTNHNKIMKWFDIRNLNEPFSEIKINNTIIGMDNYENCLLWMTDSCTKKILKISQQEIHEVEMLNLDLDSYTTDTKIRVNERSCLVYDKDNTSKFSVFNYL